MRTGLPTLILVGALAIPSVASQPAIEVAVLGVDPLTMMLDAAGGEQFANLTVRFKADATRGMYVKASPTPWHPAVGNGTVDVEGWWTEVWVGHGGAWRRLGATAGAEPVPLVDVPKDQAELLSLRIHVPAQALVEGVQYRLSYVLAAEGEGAGSAPGGVLDPSVPLVAVLSVPFTAPVNAQGEEERDEQSPEAEIGRKQSLALLSGSVLGAILILAAAGTLYLVRRRGG